MQPPLLVLGHSRLQTNGSCEINANNQPVVKHGAIGIHNGIIVNDEKLWKKFPNLKKKYAVDTEVFISILQMFRSHGQSMKKAVRSVFEEIEGSASVAMQFNDSNVLLLATNTGSLYLSFGRSGKTLIFASEKYILEQILHHKSLKGSFDKGAITQIRAGQASIIELNLNRKSCFSLKDNDDFSDEFMVSKIPHLKIFELYDQVDLSSDSGQIILTEDTKRSMKQTWETLYSDGKTLKRCTRCLFA